MTRLLSNWIDSYLKYTEDTEPPESYHYWTAVSVIASTLQRKVYIIWGPDKIYPNMYIILVGPSGRTRKGMAMSLGRAFLDSLNIPTAPDSLTQEQLTKVIEGSLDNFLDRTTNLVTYQSPTTIISPELAVFLGQKDVKFLSVLTDWYDSAKSWKRETKTAGKSHIAGLCVNILGATAPDWFQSILPNEAIGGGFTSRCIFVSETKKRQIVELPEYTREQEILREKLTVDLGEISKITGEFNFTSEAIMAYAAWYREQEERMNNGEYAVADPHFHGYCERRATHVKKLAIVMTAAHNDIGSIELQDFERARSLMERTEMKMHTVFGGIGLSPYGVIINNIREFIEIKQITTREEILKNFYHDLGSSAALDEVIRVLTDMGQLKRVTNETTNKTELVYVNA